MKKYRNKITAIDGIKFASKAEANRYLELRIMQQAGVIKDLVLQPEYRLAVDGLLICKYRADFAYTDKGSTVVEDVKGFKTPVYRLKKKMMAAILGIDVQEVA